MKILKYSMIILAGLVGVVTVCGQSTGRAKKKVVKPVSVGAAHSRTSSVDTFSPRMEAISASPPDAETQAKMRAAYAPSETFYQQAQSLYQNRDLTGAEAACFQAFEAAPVIQGQRQPIPFVAGLLGQIYLKGGQYQKAIQWLQGSRLNTAGGSLNLDLALAYIRLGDYKNASSCYTDRTILQYHFAGKELFPQDLPGTVSPGALEASILLARGMDAYYEARHDDALADFWDAAKLAPRNALTAYYCGVLLTEKGQLAQAVPMFETASTGRAIISEEANHHLMGVQSALKTARPTTR